MSNSWIAAGRADCRLGLIVEVGQESRIDGLQLRLQPLFQELCAHLPMRSRLRDRALHLIVIDAGDVEQLLKAVPPVLAILDFRKIDRVVEFPDRPAELDVVLAGEGKGRRLQNSAQEEKRTEAMAVFHLLCAFSTNGSF